MSYDEEFAAVGKQVDKLRNQLITVALNYERKISGPFCNDIYRLRDNITDRLSACYFHVELIVRHQEFVNGVVRRADADVGLHLFVERNQSRIGHLFDDIVFNLMSLFDYLSGFAGYVFFGDQIRARAKGYNPLRMGSDNCYDHLRNVLETLSWRAISEVSSAKRMSKRIGSLKGNPLKDSTTARVIVSWDESLVSRLREYRNDVIHNWADGGGWRFVDNLLDRRHSKLNVFPPFRFMQTLGYDNSDEQKTVVDASFWLIDEAFRGVENIVSALDIDIEVRRQVPRGSEHITWENEQYPPNNMGV